MTVPTLTDPVAGTTVASGLVATNNAQLRAALAAGLDDANLNSITGAKISGLVAVLPTNVVSGANTDLAWGGGTSINVYAVISTGGGTLRSLGAPTKGAGVILTFRNTHASSVTLKHLTAGGTGAQMDMRSNADVVLATDDSITFIYDGTVWVEEGRNTSSAVVSSYGTSLPGSPVDGQEYTLVDSTTNPTYQWRFRYNAGSSNADKWEYVGGSPAIIETPNSDTTASGSYTTLANAGPTFTVPRAGVYDIAAELDVGASTGGNYGLMSYDVGGTGAIDADAALGSGNGNIISARKLHRKAGIAASTALTAKYKVTGGATGTFLNRRLIVIPVRVS